MNKDEFIQQIEKMTASELNELVKAIEEKFGVSAAAFAAAAPAAGGAAAEEKDSFTVVLAKPGEQKIQVIKVLREVTGLGLKEAKDMTDKEGSVVKENVKKEEAEEIKKKLQDAGAAVELK
ncbi:MAG TPA: 50S ribosomal protein L7/L12 [Candidatus Paceibacterota bacterium]|nr:50S ribosomal protein L7/L12 [Candidatus Paceibacterota bacterium]